MEATTENLSMLSTLLTQSLSPLPEVRHPAEKNLNSTELQPGFLLLVLSLVKDDRAALDVRQAAGVYFKNVVRKRWSEETEISEFDRTAVKSQLVPIMVSLSTPGGPAAKLQSQIGEAVAEIASVDFPERWPNLLDDMVNSLSPDNFTINNGVLTTAHSIFKQWRSQFRTDHLFLTIKHVLDKFCDPYYALFQRVDQLLFNTATPLPTGTSLQELAQTLLLLLELFHDFTCQDLPEFFEDNLNVFMGDVSKASAGTATGEEFGLIGKYLRWERPELLGEDDDDVPGPIQKVRAAICEIAQLFALKYSDDFPQLGMFVSGVWQMLGTVGMGTRDDQLVSKSLGFLSVVVKMGSHRSLFEAQSTLENFVDRIILPNMVMRTHEEEMFEDDPLEYIRQDLEPSTENDTRRQAATDFTRALMQLFESQITGIVGGHINNYLQQYTANPAENWKSKDTAIYLLTSIASRGSTLHQGVTSVNALVNVVEFFTNNVFADLQAEPSAVHPILQVDAIKYLFTFRNQLTKEQLISVLPLLVRHLESTNYVVSSYAAITIERILFIKQNGLVLFTQADVRPFAESILMACFRNIESGSTPEKIAENDYLMKCVMRVIITARQSLTPAYQAILARLVAIIGETSKNPSNPRFNQYNFESISALIRFVSAGTPDAVAHFEAALFPPIQYMLSADVSEFIPYAFQICSQLLELHPVTTLPSAYENLLGPLLHAALWESRGNVPALVRLWKALILRGADVITKNNQVQGLLGIFQKLVASKNTDVYGFDLIGVMYEAVPISVMTPFTKTVLMLILNRLQTGKTPAFSQSFARFFLLLCAIPNVGPTFLVEQLQAIQPGLASQILENVILPETRKMPIKDRKVVAVGLTRLLTDGDVLLQPTTVSAWPMVLEAVLDIFNLSQDLQSTETTEDLDSLDPEESTFQASFSKLGASESRARDPVEGVPDAKLFLSKQLAAASARNPGKFASFMQAVPQESLAPFVAYMQSNK
ncbi:importin-alpha export receptor [Naganishia albida]|nr:importin-alpha export receptor [Naganishia albida]